MDWFTAQWVDFYTREGCGGGGVMGVGEIKTKYKMLELVNTKMGLEQLVYQERKDNYLEEKCIHNI